MVNNIRNKTVGTGLRSACGLLLLCGLLAGCRTNDYMLARLRDWSAPAPPHRVSTETEHQAEKLAMSEWLEKQLNSEYHVIYGEFVWLEPGFAGEAAIGERAEQFIEHTLKAAPETGTWPDDEYQLQLWKQYRGVNGSPTLIAFVVARHPTAQANGYRLAGFLELIPSDQLPPVIVCCQ